MPVLDHPDDPRKAHSWLRVWDLRYSSFEIYDSLPHERHHDVVSDVVQALQVCCCTRRCGTEMRDWGILLVGPLRLSQVWSETP